MSRRISTHKRFPKKDFKYDNLIVSLLVNRVLKHGKKSLASNLVYKALDILEKRTKKNSIYILEKVIRNISPRVQVSSLNISKSSRQIPILLSKYQSTCIAINWIIQLSKKTSAKPFYIKLSSELLDAYKGIGNLIKKKELTHRYAESNKAYIQSE